MEKRGIILTIEGTDGTGKQTQTRNLVKRAEEAGYNVFTTSFPDYESKWGKKVRAYLKGEYGGIKGVDPFQASMLYALDREEKKELFLEKLSEGCNIILDRYMESNFGHQGAKAGRKRKKMVKWLWDLEVKLLGMPPSDHVIFLDLPVKYSIWAMAERKESDIHESDTQYLKNTYKAYKMLAKQDNWTTVPCIKKTLGMFNRRRYTVDELADRVWDIAQKVLVK